MPLRRRSIQWMIVLAVSLTACKRRNNEVPIPEGDIVATLPTKTSEGQPFDPATLRGKPTVIMFASPSCGYCQKEMPLAQSAAKSKDANAVVVFVSGAKQDGMKVATKLGFTGPVLHDDGTLKQKYKITGVPYTVVLKADGTAEKAFGGMTDESTLEGALADAR